LTPWPPGPDDLEKRHDSSDSGTTTEPRILRSPGIRPACRRQGLRRRAGYRGPVLRMLMTRKWIGLTLAMLVVIAAFGALSWWQWERAQQGSVETPVLAASSVLAPGHALDPSAYGVRVRITGTYDAAHQVLVEHSPTSYWVVTPLQPADGLRVAVARAAVTSPDDPLVADVTPGVVTVVGFAQPFEGDPGTPSSLPAGRTERLTQAGLALPYDVGNGWIALQTQDPAPAVAATPVQPPISTTSTAPVRLQNASYAVQWVLFAAFVVFFWVRMLRDDLRQAGPEPTRGTATPVREVY
jgi:cytochrome oxidase assembly protein ShyY1